MPKTRKQEVGALGEQIAGTFLARKGFSVIARNYRKPWGELDLVATKGDVVVFVEVKSVSHETNHKHDNDHYHASENMHPRKIARLERAIYSFLEERRWMEREWRLDLVTVEIDYTHRIGKCAHFEGVF